MKILAEIQEKIDEYNSGLRDKIMNGIYIKQLKFTQSPRLGGGDQGVSSYQAKEPSSSFGSSQSFLLRLKLDFLNL